MAKQQRIGVYGSGIQPTGIDSGATDKMRALAGLGQTVADLGIAIAKPILKAKGSEKGAQAAEEAFKDGTEVKKKTFGFSASEYNAAAEQKTAELERNAKAVYVAELNRDNRIAIADAGLKYKDDPEGHASAIETYRKATLSAITDPVLKAQADEDISRMSLGAQIQIKNAYDIKTNNDNIAVIANESLSAFEEAERLIVGGDLIGARNEFDKSIMAIQAVGRMDSDFDVEKAISGLERQYDTVQLTTAASDMADRDGFVAANQMIQNIEKKIPKNFTVSEWKQTINQARSELTKQESLFNSAKAVSTNEDKSFFTDGVMLIASGKTLSTEDTARLNQIAGNNLGLQKQITVASNTAVFSGMPTKEQDEVINNMNSSDPENVDQLRSYFVAQGNIQKSLRNNPWNTAIEQGVLTEEEQAEFAEFDVTRLLTKNLSVEEQAQYQEAYTRNKEIAARLSEHYDYTFAPFDNQQIQAISDAIPQMTPKEKVELAGSIGTDSAIYGILADKEAGLFATAATIQNTNTQAAIFAGQQRIDSMTTTKFSDDGDMMYDAIFDAVGDTLGDEERRLTYNAAKAHYASTFEGKNYAYEPGDFKQSIMAITGEIKSTRGFKTIPPSYSQGNNDGTVANLDGFIKDMDLATFLELGGKADPYTESRVVGTPTGVMKVIEVEGDRSLNKLKSYRIKATNGHNNYELLGPNGVIMLGANKTPLIINVNEERMGNYIANKNSKRMDKYGEFLQNDRFTRDVMGLFEPEGSPYFESTGAKEYSGVGQFAKELFTGGLLEGQEQGMLPEGQEQGMLRPDGSTKSKIGYLGPVARDDGDTMTELSIGVKIDGVETLVPSMIPTLTKTEVEVLRTLPEGKKIPEAIQEKAAAHARKRMAAGLNPFYQDGEEKENLYSAVEMVESSGNVNAVSPKGAFGPMQLMPATAKNPGFGIKPIQDNSPEENRRVGAEYLDALLEKYNDNLDNALAAYNWGPGNTDKWLKAGANKSDLPKETRDYLVKVRKQLGK